MKDLVGDKILQDYENSYKNLAEIYQEIPPTESKVIELTRQIYLSIQQDKPLPDLYLESFSESDISEDVSAYFCFLLSWAILCLKKLNLQQAASLIERAESLQFSSDDQKTAREFLLLRVKGGLAFFENRFSDYRHILQKQFYSLQPQIPLYYKSIANYLQALIDFEDIEEFHKILNLLNHDKSEVAQDLLTYFHFLFDLINFKLPDFENILPKIDKAIKQVTQLGNLISAAYIAENLARINLIHEVPHEVLKKYPLTNPEVIESNRILSLLIDGKPEEALKAIENNWPEDNQYIFDNIFIRVQLANKKVDTAQSYLNKKISKNNFNSYLDYFYKARIALIKGNLSEAQQHFHKFFKLVTQYGVGSRIFAELKFACEMQLNNFLKLIEDALFLIPTSSQVLESSESSSTDSIQPPPIHNRKSDLIGTGSWYRQLSNKIQKFSNLDHVILITGETGTGKEMVARALHESSSRRNHPFIAINCGAFTKFLLESELFGHAKGAFTGAEKTRKGLIEEAGHGTLFLDEIGDMPLELQVSLLRVLENKEFRPVGSNKTLKAHCRIICATHQNLEELSHSDGFRKDLYYRLAALTIFLPPLRERKFDLSILSKYFFSQGHQQGNRVELTTRLINAFNKYHWPGNIRELRNEIEYMKIMNRDQIVYDLEDLRPDFTKRLLTDGFRNTSQASQMDSQNRLLSYQAEEADFVKLPRKRRRQMITELFQKHQKLSRQKICQLLNVSPATATNDLKILADKGVISKICPTESPRTHYFVCRSEN